MIESNQTPNVGSTVKLGTPVVISQVKPTPVLVTKTDVLAAAKPTVPVVKPVVSANVVLPEHLDSNPTYNSRAGLRG